MLLDAAPGRLKVGRPVAVIDVGSNSVRLVAYGQKANVAAIPAVVGL